MKVLLDVPLARGGVGRYAAVLIEGLGLFPGAELIVLDRSRRSFGYRAFTPWGRAAVRLHSSLVQADLVHGLHLDVAPGRRPATVTVPDLIPLEYPASMPARARRSVFERLVRRSVRRASAVIVPSAATRDSLEARGIPIDKVEVIPHGAPRGFVPLGSSDKLRARVRFAHGDAYFACLANDRPHKNFSVVRDVSRLLSESDPRLVAAGPVFAADAPYLEWVGHLSDQDLALFFGGAEALLIPSLIEGFGFPALEAIATGTPVVCGRGLGAFPFIEDAVVEADVKDPRSIADALLSLAASPLREEKSKAALRVADNLTLKRMAQATLEVYKAVLG